MPGNLLMLPETQACELHETGGKLVGLRHLRHDLKVEILKTSKDKG